MLRQSVKDLYFMANRILVMPNTWRASFKYRTPAHPEGHYLHVGCGEKYLDGFINIDGNLGRRVDCWLDLRNALPFADQSTHFIYCAHTLEHLYVEDAINLLAEFHRILKPDGTARVAVPSFEHGLKIAAGHPAEDPQRRFDDPYGQAIDYLFCDGQHRYCYSFSVLEKFARQVGFTRVYHYSADHGLAAKQYGRVTVEDVLAGSLIVELQR